MNNPLMQGILARTAAAHGETTAAQGNVSSGQQEYLADKLPESDGWAEAKARTEQVLGEVLRNFGGAAKESVDWPVKDVARGASAEPYLRKQVLVHSQQSPVKLAECQFVAASNGDSGYYTSTAPYRWGYFGAFPAHTLAALAELEGEFGRSIRNVSWELAGEKLVLSGESTDEVQVLVGKLLQKIEERNRQEITYPGGSVDSQYYPRIGKELAHYLQQELNLKMGPGETIGYLAVNPPVMALAYKNLFAPAWAAKWQGGRLWVKGPGKETEKFFQRTTTWILEQLDHSGLMD